jgi:hypothetical protein
MNVIDGILNSLKELSKRVDRLELTGYPVWKYLSTPLTSASWDGDTYSDTAKTLIDLSAVFGVPAGVKAILVDVAIKDIDSTGPDDNYIILSPNAVAGSGPIVRSKGRYDNDLESQQLTVPCDANGDIYYETAASGVLSLAVYLSIWAYYI